MKESDVLLFYVGAISALVIYVLMLSTFTVFEYLNVIQMPISSIPALIALIVIFIINYFTFVKPKKFLEYNFEKGMKGGVGIMVFLIMLTSFYITVANFNRDKLQRERGPVKQENVKPSLEGKIRKWFKENLSSN